MFKRQSEILYRLVPVLLIFSFALFSAVSLRSISMLQGDARVINYAGIVRGATQRLIKQEMNQAANDELIAYLDGILEELQNGSGDNGLVVLHSPEFLSDIRQMQESWQEIKQEIYQVRAGKPADRLFWMSEEYFVLANDAVGKAEAYSEQKVSGTAKWLLMLNMVLAALAVAFWIYRIRQKRVYDALQAAESASKEKSEFLSRMSHEIRTPMNGIIGMTAIAKSCAKDPVKVKECLEKIQLSSDYLLSLINDILDMARIESGKVTLCSEAFDLMLFGDRIYTMFSQKAQSSDIEFSIKHRNISCPVVVGDELRISQVIVNIVSNALKFTPAGGRVFVELEQQMAGTGKAELIISVSDSGIGMTEEFRKRMFEPFEQADSSIVRQYGGTGLGLAISYNLIQRMNGRLTVESEVGKGSCFRVSLMLSLENNMAAVGRKEQVKERAGTDNLKGIHILLAEDNEINSEIAAAMLEINGGTLDKAWNGREAADLFIKSDKERYQLIMMDIQMPVMNGLDACKVIRQSSHPRAKTIPIIGVSANVFTQDIERAKDCGMNDYLFKPIDISQLLCKIQAMLQEESHNDRT